ncbi:hypothetical protein N9H22_03115 [Opitutales bacterium]|nr:hypothetical protein [Opitutales bacterium]
MINSMVSVNRKDFAMIPKFLFGSLFFGLMMFLNPGVCFAQDPLFTENLKAYFKFDGDLNSTYPEIIGSGSATLTTDRYGNLNSALEFDGIDDTFSFSIDEPLWNNFAISVWVKPTKTTTIVSETTSGMSMFNVTPQSPLLYAAHGGSNRTYGFNIGTNGLNVTHYADSLVISSLAYTSDLSEWKHYTFISDSDKAKLYINGSFIKDGLQMSDLYCGSSFTFGNSAPLSTKQYFKGHIDDLFIYDRLLLSSEVPLLYNPEPYSLNYLSYLSISENQIIGSIVGEFNANHPDGDTLTYSLINGEGAIDNESFTMDLNGTLRSAQIFDYEENAGPFFIRVQAMDESNATTAGDFNVTILNTTDFLVTLNIEDNGSVLGAGDYDQNASVNLVATPSLGFVFAGWSGDFNSSEFNTSFLINADFNITALFGEDTSDLDNDGLSNYYELVVFDSNISNPDTDGDGFTDFEENRTGLDPNQPNTDYKLLRDSALAEANTSGFLSGLNLAYTNRKIYELNTSDELQFQYGYADGSQDALKFHLNDPSFPFTELELNASRLQAEQDQLSAIHNELVSGVGGLTYLQNLQRVSAPNAANWYYQPGMGWLWTNQDVYPLVYFADSNETGGPRWIYSIRLEDAADGSYYDYLLERMIGSVAD